MKTWHDSTHVSAPLAAGGYALAALLLAIAPMGCSSSHAPGGPDDGGVEDGGLDGCLLELVACPMPPPGCELLPIECGCGEIVCPPGCDPAPCPPAPGGCTFVSYDECGCGVELDCSGGCDMAPCPLPPAECTFVSYDECGCGLELVCDAFCECPAPPEGCWYGSSETDCGCDGPLVCGGMTWSAPGGFAGTGPALRLSLDGLVSYWSATTSPDDRDPDWQTYVPSEDILAVLDAWSLVPLATLPRTGGPLSDCYPSVTVQRCQGCALEALAYRHPTELLPEMEPVWSAIESLPLDWSLVQPPRGYCAF